MKAFLKFLVLLIICATSFACSEKENSVAYYENSQFSERSFKLGKKLQNPYSVENMEKAYLALDIKTRLDVDKPIDDIVYPTHAYVKFKFESREDLERIERDTTLGLYPYPLDYEILEEGCMPESYDSCGYRYASVPIDYAVPDSVNCELVEELFISDDGDTVYTRSGCNLTSDFIEALVDKSLELTGNSGPDELNTRGKSSWNPSGIITAYDNATNSYIPLHRVKVRARRWFTTHKAYTNEYGYYRCASFKRPANYSVVWEGTEWDTRFGWFGQAIYNGPKKQGDWNLAINQSMHKTLVASVVHRVANRYYNGNIGGLARPMNLRKEKICILNKDGRSDYWGNIGMGALPDIRIYIKDGNNYRKTPSIFATVSHELGHVSHCTLITKIKYWQVSDIIVESWANFVSWAFLQLEYDALNANVSTYIAHRAKQSWPVGSSDKEYSSLFVDLVDNYNQGANNPALPFDEVYGFSYSTLNVLLLLSKDMESLKENLKIWKPSFISNVQIDKLFECYENNY